MGKKGKEQKRRPFCLSVKTPATLKAADDILICLKGVLGRFRHGDIATEAKWGLGDVQVVGHDHKRFKVDGVCNIIRQKGIEKFLLSALLVSIPKNYGVMAVHPLQSGTINAELSLTALESAFVAEGG